MTYAVQGVAQHRLRDLGHPRDVDEFLHRRVHRIALGGFRDVHRQVAHPLEIGVDLDRGHDGPEVRRHRLVQRQQLQHAVVDLDVELVDRFVAGQDRFDEAEVALGQALNGMAHAFLGQPAHFEQAGPEHFEFFLQMSDEAFHGSRISYPKRPVT